MSTAFITMVQLDCKSDLDKITATFDCYTNPAIENEAILDTSCIDEAGSHDDAIELFGKNGWEAMRSGLVLFHP
jgi:hypothetical protein